LVKDKYSGTSKTSRVPKTLEVKGKNLEILPITNLAFSKGESPLSFRRGAGGEVAQKKRSPLS
jgi:hypothetical protein